MPDDPPAPSRRSRAGLFAPFALLGLVVVGWITAWFVIRDGTVRALDSWIAGEAAHGRQWTCPNRTVGGFPFRIEVRCDAVSLQRPGSSLAVGAVTAVAQVYRPRHLIAYVAGPLRAGDGTVGIDGNWRLLQASLRTTATGLQRASVVAEAPALRLTGLAPGGIDISAQRVETHLRPHPGRMSEGAYDWSLQAAKAAVPGLDFLVGGTEPADIDVQLTATQARDLAARPLADELERWREAGGRIEIDRVALAKGARRIEGKGQVGLDEAHRLQGRAELAAAGLEGLLGTFVNAGGGTAGALIGALTGRTRAEARQPAAGAGERSALKPLPPVRLEGGRVLVGPLALPGLRLPPLY